MREVEDVFIIRILRGHPRILVVPICREERGGGLCLNYGLFLKA